MKRQIFNVDTLGQAGAVLLCFALPISTALTSILMGVVFVAWFFGKNRAQKWQIASRHRVLDWIYPLMLLSILGVLYSTGESESILNGLSDSLRLLLIPILLYFYRQPKMMTLSLWAFILAMCVTLILVFLKVYGGLPIGLKYSAGAIFKSHIKTSFFMAMAVFFLAHQIKSTPRYRMVLGMIIALMIYYLFFINAGRIGYLTLMVLSLLFFWQHLRLKGVLIGSTCVIALLCITYLTSSVFNERINMLSQDLDFYHQGGRLAESSLGSRLQFAESSLELMAKKPLLGWGTGSFGAAYASLYEGKNTLLTDNPHNEYLRLGVEFGGLGLLVLLLMFAHQWQLMKKLPDNMKMLGQGFLLTFILGCFFNSWIRDATEGVFYCVMIALIFSTLPLPERKFLVKASVH